MAGVPPEENGGEQMSFDEIIAPLAEEFKKEKRNEAQFRDWLEMGEERGWVSRMFCMEHDGPPITEWEATQVMHGNAPCIIGVRVLLYTEGPKIINIEEGE